MLDRTQVPFAYYHILVIQLCLCLTLIGYALVERFPGVPPKLLTMAA